MFILNTAGNCEVDVGKGIGGNCVSRLCRELNIPQPSASHYVKGLIDAGLIIQVRSGRRRFLFPDPSAADELQNFTQFVSEKVIPVPHSD